jgi:hypothetical protein
MSGVVLRLIHHYIAVIINRYISNFNLDFHLPTTLLHWGWGNPRITFLPYEMTLKTYQTKIKFRALRVWRGILREQFSMTSVSVPGNNRSIRTSRI